MNDLTLLSLLQLASPTLPVGAYSYSEGLEALVDTSTIANKDCLGHWLEQEVRYGAIRIEAAVMVRAYSSVHNNDLKALGYWNEWLSAAKETEELRQQSWQMGRSLVRLLLDLQLVDFPPNQEESASGKSVRSLLKEVNLPCHYAIAFGIAAAHWQIPISETLLGYLHSWATNLINAGVKLVPLGQTAGQQLLLSLQPILSSAAKEILTLPDDDLNSCGWGLALASMAHENQYTRLFRS